MASFTSSATKCGARKHAWTNKLPLNIKNWTPLTGPLLRIDLGVLYGCGDSLSLCLTPTGHPAAWQLQQSVTTKVSPGGGATLEKVLKTK